MKKRKHLKGCSHQSKKKRWTHVGGGTLLDGSGGRFPSDDTFETEAGNTVTIRCTKDRHFDLPHSVNSISELLKLSGVSKRIKRGRR